MTANPEEKSIFFSMMMSRERQEKIYLHIFLLICFFLFHIVVIFHNILIPVTETIQDCITDRHRFTKVASLS